jgi:hypothetical protein
MPDIPAPMIRTSVSKVISASFGKSTQALGRFLSD